MSGQRRTGWLWETAAVVIVVFLIALALVPNGRPPSEAARLAEVKANLHHIHLALERYAVDYGGAYPRYLIGGEARWAGAVDVHNRINPFSDPADCPELRRVADPLLALGYLDSYPRNPFARNGLDVYKAQLSLPLNAPAGDPLRDGLEAGRLYGTRFGPYGTTMGQVLAARLCWGFASARSGGRLSLNGVASAPIPGLPPGADLAYPCLNTWNGINEKNPLPGQFVYTALGPVVTTSTPTYVNEGSAPPGRVSNYILAAFGGPRTLGQDLFDAAGVPIAGEVAGVYRLPLGEHFRAANARDIRDGIILVLTSQDDHPGKGPR